MTQQSQNSYLIENVRLKSKSESRLMRVIAWILKPVVPNFLDGYWTTIGETIYYPDGVIVSQELNSLDHELVHVRQWRKHGLWFWFSYLFLPVPIGLAWFRWRWEREAYLVQLNAGWPPEAIVDSLCSAGYLWPWPKEWALAWFRKQQKF